jgi:Fic family protein
MVKYIYENENWTDFYWDDAAIGQVFGEVRHLQGKILGQMALMGFDTKSQSQLNNLIQDVVKTSEIEGERLDYDLVRSSIARKLGLNEGGLSPSNRHVEGIVEILLDATQRFQEPLSHQRLFGWHAALFPTGYSGMYKIEVGAYRTGEMEVVSGALGKQKVHYQAVPAEKVQAEMERFITWFNESSKLDPVIKAAIAHFWFIIVHPFDDGNGRIARALADMLLARADQTAERHYSFSTQIMIEQKQYYSVLQRVQYSDGDITDWLMWFLTCLKNSLLAAETTLERVVAKASFWNRHAETLLNVRQQLLLNKLLDGFEGKLQTSKWAKIAKCSHDTALRDIKDLLDKGILKQEEGGGRSTNYELVGTTLPTKE